MYTKVVCRFLKYFIPNKLEKIAKETGFMVRNSKLLVDTFVKALTLSCLDARNITEEIIAHKCSLIQNGVSLTKQAISYRLEKCIPFLKKLISLAMSKYYRDVMDDSCLKLSDIFSDVKLLDATTISLPDNLYEDYRGMGGRNAKSSLKIQTVYSAVHHTISHFDITSGVTHDVNEWDNIVQKLTENELIIADLGYYDFEAFKKISERNYFFSRIKKNRKFYVVDADSKSGYKTINLTNLLKQNKDFIDTEVYIKSVNGEILKVRLVGNKLNNRIAQKRIQKSVLNNNKKNISSNLKILLHWNLVITNVPKEKLSASIVSELYRLRWQIELLFKSLKSSFGIDKINTGSKNYAEAIIYGRLLGAVLTMPLYDSLNTTMLKTKGRGISMIRFYKLYIVSANALVVQNLFKLSTYHNFCDNLLKIAKLSLTEKRVRQTTYAKIESLLGILMEFGKT